MIRYRTGQYKADTGSKGRKPDKISLSKEFFDGADIDIEVKAKAKVIYESNTEDIFNILFSAKFLMNRESCME